MDVVFDYVNGITENAPVRLAGVNAGEVKNIDIYYDADEMKTRVNVGIWLNGEVKVETDSVARINTLGLLGEQYLEITPGVARSFLGPGEKLFGKNPVNVGQQMEGMNDLIQSFTKVMQRVEKGEGTIGKLLSDDALYDDLAAVVAGIREGKGTLGKLLSDEKVYNDLEGFVADIKAHPWKLLSKPSARSSRKKEEDKGKR
jgi:phospholipid/cholesterol/gamma-HCH transport system substrate-binding protein